MLPSTEPARIAVRAEREYDVLVGYGLLAEVPELLGPGVQRAAVLHPPTMIKTAEQVAHQLIAAGLEPVRVDVPDGEAAKSVAVAERCWSILGNAGFTRSDAVVGLGGARPDCRSGGGDQMRLHRRPGDLDHDRVRSRRRGPPRCPVAP